MRDGGGEGGVDGHVCFQGRGPGSLNTCGAAEGDGGDAFFGGCGGGADGAGAEGCEAEVRCDRWMLLGVCMYCKRRRRLGGNGVEWGRFFPFFFPFLTYLLR